MAEFIVQQESLEAVANAIKTKAGMSESDKIVFPEGWQSAIAAISSGDGIQYNDIIYNDDGSITLIDTNGNEHTITCVYENNRLLSMTYDGNEVVTVYDDGKLVSVGETEVDVENAPLDNTLENIIDESGVLPEESKNGTVKEKIENLIDYADLFKKASGIVFARTDIETITMDCSGLTNLNSAFDTCRSLKEIHLSNTQNVTTWQYFLYSCSSLTTVETLDLSGREHRTNSWLVAGIDNLRTFKVEPETISFSISIPAPKLTDGTDGTFNSIQSIIDGLATVETAQTLKLHADVKAKLTDDQLATITSKNWNLA